MSAIMFDLFKTVRVILKFDTVRIDNNVSRLHYKLTVILLVVFSLLVTSKQYFGDPIHCHLNKENGLNLDTYCWVFSTFTVTKHLRGITGKSSVQAGVGTLTEKDETISQKYYQWVCFVLALQAATFYIPRHLWKTWEGGRLKMLVGDLGLPILSSEWTANRKKMLLRYIVTNRNTHTLYVCRFIICEILNSVNVLLLCSTYIPAQSSTTSEKSTSTTTSKYTETTSKSDSNETISQKEDEKKEDEKKQESQSTGSSDNQSKPSSGTTCTQEGFMGDNKDCKKFYRCVDNGKGGYTKYEFQCGEGTVWDPDATTCNHDWAVNRKDCQSGESSESAQSSSATESSSESTSTSSPKPTSKSTTSQIYTETTRSEVKESTTESGQTSDNTTTDKKKEPTLGSTCKEEGFMGDDKNCKKFYRCVDNGKGGYTKYEFNCGEGTVWDPELTTCNHDWAVNREGCGKQKQKPEQTSTMSSSSEQPSSSESSTTQKSTTPSTTQDKPTEESTSKPTQSESNMSSSTTTTEKLSSTTQSSTTKETTSASSETTTTEKEKITESNSTTTTTESQKKPSSGECTEEGFYPHPDDCTKFYRCVDNEHGGYTKYDFDCPEGTYWDPDVTTCNHKNEVNRPECNELDSESNSATSTTSSTTARETESTTTKQTTQAETTTSGEMTTQSETTTSAETTSTAANQTTTESGSTTTEGADTTVKQTTTESESTTSKQTTTTESSSTTSKQTTTESEATTTGQTTTTEGSSTTSNQTTTESEATTTGQTTTTDGSSTTSNQTTSESEATTTGQTTTTESSSTTSKQTTAESEMTTTGQTTTTEGSSTTSKQTTTESEMTTTGQTTTTEGSSTTSKQTTTESETTTTGQTTTTEGSSTTAKQTTTENESTSSEQTTTEGKTTTESTEGTSSTTESEKLTSESTTSSQTTTQSCEDGSCEQTTESTTSQPQQGSDCPVSNLESDQVAIICPTGFRRHPKYCNLFYQCTTNDTTHEMKVLVLSCPEERIFDDEKIQCLLPEETKQKCDGEMANTASYRQLNQRTISPINIRTKRSLCPYEGHYGLFEKPKQNHCTRQFIKCEKSNNSQRSITNMRGYLYQCPSGYAYWSISKRCERVSRIPDCKRTRELERWDIPVEMKNVSF